MVRGTAVDVPTAEGDAVTTKPGRIRSLDFVRGVFLCFSVASVSTLAPRPEFLKHEQWFGVAAVDLIFPLFVTLSGCGLAFAYRNRVGWAATLRRFVVLMVAGLVYNAIGAGTLDLSTLRFTGVLQLYAMLVLVIGLLHLLARSAVAWMGLTAVLAAAQWLVLAGYGATCPGDVLLPTCNPSKVIDTAVFGVHMYAAGERGHDPEGLVAILGALVTASVGVTAGHLALQARGSYRGPAYLVAWAVVAYAGASAAGLTVPEFKRLWTTPFALGVAALGVVILAVGLAVMDLPAPRWWEKARSALAWPMVAQGRNSLLVYFGSHIVVEQLAAHGGVPSHAEELASAVDFVDGPQLSFVLVNVAFWVVLACVLHRRRIYLRP